MNRRNARISWPRLASLALGLSLAACVSQGTGGERVREAEEILISAWREPPATPAPADPAPGVGAAADPVLERDPATPWSLEELLVEIAARNPTLAGALATLEEAEAQRAELEASYLPVLSIGADFVSTDQPTQAFGLLMNQEQLSLGPGFDPTPGAIENWHEQVRLDWTVFAPGRGESLSAAREGEEVARLAAEALERRLLNAGVQAWLGLRTARELEAVARESVGVVEERLARTRVREREGAALRADVLRLEVRLATVRQEVAQAALATSRAESGLNQLMGRAASAPLALENEIVRVGVDLPGEVDALLALASTQRLDLRATAAHARALGIRAEAVRAERMPLLHVFGSYDVNGEDLPPDLELDSYVLGVGLRFSPSPGTRARIRRAEAAERRELAMLEERVRSAEREVRDAWEALRATEESLVLAQSAVSLAEESFGVLAAAQDAGGATVTDVLEADDARRSARVRHVAAEAGVELARARLVAATGGVR